MKDYKAIFDGIESTLLRVGSRRVPQERIAAELEPYKHYEGRRLVDDEYYSMLVHIIFYSGFRAQAITDKLAAIDRHFPNFRRVAEYGSRDVQAMLNDDDMIRNRMKIQACIENAKAFREVVAKFGSFPAYVDSFRPSDSPENLLRLRDDMRQRFKGLGETVVYHFLMEIGMPVLKPDRVVRRIFSRLGLAAEDADAGTVIAEGHKFVHATGHPIRYIDIVVVAYGQVQTKELGLEQGICVDPPNCSICAVTSHCDYYAQARRAAGQGTSR